MSNTTVVRRDRQALDYGEQERTPGTYTVARRSGLSAASTATHRRRSQPRPNGTDEEFKCSTIDFRPEQDVDDGQTTPPHTYHGKPKTCDDEQEVPMRRQRRSGQATTSTHQRTPIYEYEYEDEPATERGRRQEGVTRQLPESEPPRQMHWLFSLGLGMLLLLGLNLGLVAIRNTAYTHYLAATAPMPVAQLEATLVGQHLHFVVVDLNRQLSVIEINEQNPKQTVIFQGPTLGWNADEAVTLHIELRDVNGDRKPDLVVTANTASVNFFWQPTMAVYMLLNTDGSHFKSM